MLALVVWCGDHPLSKTVLEKKAIPFLTKAFAKFARLELKDKNLSSNDSRRCFVANFLHGLDYISTVGAGCPYILQALRNNILHGIVACTSFLPNFLEMQGLGRI